MGLHDAVAASSQNTVCLLDDKGRAREEARNASDLAFSIQEAGGFRRCTWRTGTRKNPSARFALRRVNAGGCPRASRNPSGCPSHGAMESRSLPMTSSTPKLNDSCPPMRMEPPTHIRSHSPLLERIDPGPANCQFRHLSRPG
ncbi:Transposase [Stigmatella aurantiaca DW4/3-1]|uniref:Transposase n=1 Tax=Stigmatella aurantiaca (strain DW4/3-1) TaxID=378806 RepID=E3FVS6_STIAD|nr:Transposase [Stigmatella aurantiaca DW4/3-1]